MHVEVLEYLSDLRRHVWVVNPYNLSFIFTVVFVVVLIFFFVFVFTFVLILFVIVLFLLLLLLALAVVVFVGGRVVLTGFFARPSLSCPTRGANRCFFGLLVRFDG